ncbi:pullanase-associated protein [Anaeromyxobacter sp. K]|uniref:pullulanase-associated domain-containing protein n=1 Tax=Anaeromyxobacter sp. (strain K) TaxID=447217 RepID=UPI00015F936D|nr:pullulanase-associated domain-containing protein [Anaeromyxobacter sp. K]ACG75465.1 pullanase-associated protein [Anaeromyxobacter sp. K]
MKRIFEVLAAGLIAAVMGFAGPAAAEEKAAAAGDNVTLHYHRADGSYDGWALHSWESFQAKSEASDEWAAKQMSDRPLKGVTWFKPMQPAGKDDFGVFWTIPAAEFENGRVNYIIHKGDKKDQCNKDMFWMIKDSKEAWVVSGDCKVYLSKADAEKAMKK